MKISQTRNYSQFVHDATNRPITEKDRNNLRQLKRSMQKYGFLPMPILVRRSGDKLRIIDGQHRFSVAQELKLPVLYTETERDDIDISIPGGAQAPWKLSDHVMSKAAQGKAAYQQLRLFVEETKLPLSKAASILAGQTAKSGNVQKYIKEGTFKVSDENYAHRVANMVQAVKRFVPWAMHSQSINAISRFARVPEFDDSQFIKKVESHSHLLRHCATLEDFSEMYDAIYNHMTRSRIPLAFLAREAMAKRVKGR
jgi:hypothetical protein